MMLNRLHKQLANTDSWPFAVNIRPLFIFCVCVFKGHLGYLCLYICMKEMKTMAFCLVNGMWIKMETFFTRKIYKRPYTRCMVHVTRVIIRYKDKSLQPSSCHTHAYTHIYTPPPFPFMFLIHGQRAFGFSRHASHQHIRELAWGHTYISDPCIMKHEAANCRERLLCQRLIGISFAALPRALHTSQGSCSIYFRPSHFSSVKFTPCVWWVTHSPAW